MQNAHQKINVCSTSLDLYEFTPAEQTIYTPEGIFCALCYIIWEGSTPVVQLGASYEPGVECWLYARFKQFHMHAPVRRIITDSVHWYPVLCESPPLAYGEERLTLPPRDKIIKITKEYRIDPSLDDMITTGDLALISKYVRHELSHAE